MKTFKVSWVEHHKVEVEAASEAEAIEKAQEMDVDVTRRVIDDTEAECVFEDPHDAKERALDAFYGV